MMTAKMSEKDSREEILKAFRLFDDDETGKISFRNLKRVAKELGENMTDEELQEMIDEADRDGDGEINEDEFLRIMKKTSLCVARADCARPQPPLPSRRRWPAHHQSNPQPPLTSRSCACQVLSGLRKRVCPSHGALCRRCRPRPSPVPRSTCRCMFVWLGVQVHRQAVPRGLHARR